jgi:hypothetical protein
VVRAVALDLSPLLADKDIDFEIATVPAPVRAHDWMLRELTRNLLHNAIKHTPAGCSLSVRVVADAHHAALTVADSGPASAPSCARGCSSRFRRATCAAAPAWAWPSATRSPRRWAAALRWTTARRTAASLGWTPRCACRWRPRTPEPGQNPG